MNTNDNDRINKVWEHYRNLLTNFTAGFIYSYPNLQDTLKKVLDKPVDNEIIDIHILLIKINEMKIKSNDFRSLMTDDFKNDWPFIDKNKNLSEDFVKTISELFPQKFLEFQNEFYG